MNMIIDFPDLEDDIVKAIGENIFKFNIMTEIGQGSYSNVYMAERGGQKFALKVIKM
jgi:hypothetical protein